jgi:hypothetical protein
VVRHCSWLAMVSECSVEEKIKHHLSSCIVRMGIREAILITHPTAML